MPKRSFLGIEIKYVALLALALQNCMQMVFMRYSRTMAGPKYLTSTAVVMQEVVKIPVCLALLFVECGGSASETFATLRRDFLGPNPLDTALVLVPALIYTIQNNLLYVATSHLDAATCQVTYQLKILTTAMCAKWMLRKTFTSQQWFSLVVLTAGVILVQSPGKVSEQSTHGSNPLVGFLAALTACLLSGFAGIFLEKVLKTGHLSVWVSVLLCSDGTCHIVSLRAFFLCFLAVAPLAHPPF